MKFNFFKKQRKCVHISLCVREEKEKGKEAKKEKKGEKEKLRTKGKWTKREDWIKESAGSIYLYQL